MLPRSSQERFEKFHAAHPEIYAFIVKKARQAKTWGHKRYSLRTIWEVARWTLCLDPIEETFKLNDHYPPFYARMIMEREPDLKGFFELRSPSAVIVS